MSQVVTKPPRVADQLSVLREKGKVWSWPEAAML